MRLAFSSVFVAQMNGEKAKLQRRLHYSLDEHTQKHICAHLHRFKGCQDVGSLCAFER